MLNICSVTRLEASSFTTCMARSNFANIYCGFSTWIFCKTQILSLQILNKVISLVVNALEVNSRTVLNILYVSLLELTSWQFLRIFQIKFYSILVFGKKSYTIQQLYMIEFSCTCIWKCFQLQKKNIRKASSTPVHSQK